MEQSDVVRHTLALLAKLELEYAIVGSFASITYGEPRFTNDIDILVDLPANKVAEFCNGIPGPEWYVSLAAASDAVLRRSQFNVIHATSGNKVDVIVTTDSEWARFQLSRRQEVGIIDELTGFAAHPEDVILGKLIYYKDGGSDKHLRDIAGIFAISSDKVDRSRLREWARKLGVDDVLAQFEAHLDDSL